MALNIILYSKTSELRTSRTRLPPSYDRFFIDGLFSLLCICKSSLWNTITSQTRHTMMKNGRNTIGHKFLSLEKSFFRVNYRKISRDGFIVTEFPAILSLVHHFESNLRHGWFPLIKGKSPPVTQCAWAGYFSSALWPPHCRQNTALRSKMLFTYHAFTG